MGLLAALGLFLLFGLRLGLGLGFFSFLGLGLGHGGLGLAAAGGLAGKTAGSLAGFGFGRFGAGGIFSGIQNRLQGVVGEGSVGRVFQKPLVAEILGEVFEHLAVFGLQVLGHVLDDVFQVALNGLAQRLGRQVLDLVHAAFDALFYLLGYARVHLPDLLHRHFTQFPALFEHRGQHVVGHARRLGALGDHAPHQLGPAFKHLGQAGQNLGRDGHGGLAHAGHRRAHAAGQVVVGLGMLGPGGLGV